MQVFAGLKSDAADASSGTSVQGTAGNVSGGPNGSSTTESASTTGSTSVADTLVLGVLSEGGTNTYTPGSGFTLIDEARTASGAQDRGCLFEYRVVSATGVQTATVGQSSVGGWAGVVAAFKLDEPFVSTTPSFKEWNGTSWITLTPKQWDFDTDTWNTLELMEL
jgi:hypothetical protein